MSEHDWTSALAAVTELGTLVERTGLLQGALDSGFLAHCRRPTTVAALARAADLDHRVTAHVCTALRSLGVLDADEYGAHVVISERYAPLLERGLDRRARDRLAAAAVRAGMFRGLFDGTAPTYWDLDSPSRLALAANATGDPETAFGRELLVGAVRADPDWDAAFTRGGRFLECGCGVAGAIVSALHAYPRLRAVGIDLAEDVLEVARARALALGVADRARFLRADAATFRDPAPFDVAFWAHTFYPEDTRAAVLATLRANLRPGGLLVTVAAPDPAPRPDAGHALEPLLRSMWGIGERSAAALHAELAGAGFRDITPTTVVAPVLPLVKARRGE